MIHFIDIIAIRKAKTQGWRPCIWKICGDDVLVKGGVPVGESKGRPKWGPKKSLDTVLVARVEIEQEEKKFEIETGKCSECRGDGKTASRISFNRETGETSTEHRECFKCKGTGKPNTTKPTE